MSSRDVTAVPSAWAKRGDHVLTRLRRSYENAVFAKDAYRAIEQRDSRIESELALACSASRNALLLYLETRKP